MEQTPLPASSSGSRAEGGSTRFDLDNVSVVVLAHTHNPSIINAEFLRENDIIGNDWKMDSIPPSFSSDVVSLISFIDNSIVWQVERDRLTIQEKVEGDFKETYRSHGCAKKYAKILKHIPYNALGMNWHFSAEKKAFDWMKSRFFREGKWKDSVELSGLTFKPSPPWTLTLSGKKVQDKLQLELGCNYHVDISSDDDKVAKICSIIDALGSHQDTLKQTMIKYFKEELE